MMRNYNRKVLVSNLILEEWHEAFVDNKYKGGMR